MLCLCFILYDDDGDDDDDEEEEEEEDNDDEVYDLQAVVVYDNEWVSGDIMMTIKVVMSLNYSIDLAN